MFEINTLDQQYVIWETLKWNLKNYCHNWNQRPRIYLIANFGAKMNGPKLGTKNSLLLCHIENENENSQILETVVK